MLEDEMSETAYVKIPLQKTVNVTKIVTLLSYDLSPDYKNSGETHDFWELIYVERGEISYRRGSETCRLKSGEIAFHEPEEFHSVECNGKSGASVFIATFDCRSPAMKYFCGRQMTIPTELVPVLTRLADECDSGFYVSEYPLRKKEDQPIGAQQLVRIYLEELLIRLMRLGEREERVSAPRFRGREKDGSLSGAICEYLAQNVGARVTLDDLSERFHFGKSRLCEIFKRDTGDTILNYHLKLKIKEAKYLLREGKLTVGEISASLGFETPEYFSRYFKKSTGKSPRDYRNAPKSDSTVYLDRETPLI